MTNTDKVNVTYITEGEDGKLHPVVGTVCSPIWCRENGCDFPYCAELGEESFDSVESARKKYTLVERV